MPNTITHVAESIAQRYGVEIPDWRLRRVLDALHSAGTITVTRVGRYRTIDSGDIAHVVAELRRLHCLPETEAASC
jgi:hypothetical protein